jgi:hypothetical protein
VATGVPATLRFPDVPATPERMFADPAIWI